VRAAAFWVLAAFRSAGTDARGGKKRQIVIALSGTSPARESCDQIKIWNISARTVRMKMVQRGGSEVRILCIIPGADFGTTNHTRKQCFASVLIDSEVRKAADPGMANFRIGTPGVPGAFLIALGSRFGGRAGSTVRQFA
jgi:hypothetical protein